MTSSRKAALEQMAAEWLHHRYGTAEYCEELAELLAAREVAVLEEAAKLAVESIQRMIVLYDGKLPYFVVQSTKDGAISNDASVALYTAEQIAQHLSESARERRP